MSLLLWMGCHGPALLPLVAGAAVSTSLSSSGSLLGPEIPLVSLGRGLRRYTCFFLKQRSRQLSRRRSRTKFLTPGPALDQSQVSTEVT